MSQGNLSILHLARGQPWLRQLSVTILRTWCDMMWVSERSEWFIKIHVWVLHCVKSDSWLSVSDRTFVRAWLVSEVVVGCWRDGTRMWCELLWRLPPPMLCDHWCCLVCPDIASWSLGTRSPQNLGLTKYFDCFMVNYEFTSADIMSDEWWSWFLNSILCLSLSTNQILCGKFRKS